MAFNPSAHHKLPKVHQHYKENLKTASFHNGLKFNFLLQIFYILNLLYYSNQDMYLSIKSL